MAYNGYEMSEIDSSLSRDVNFINRESGKLSPSSVTTYATPEELKSLGINESQINTYRKTAIEQMDEHTPDQLSRDAVPIPGLFQWACSQRLLDDELGTKTIKTTVYYRGRPVCVTSKIHPRS